MSSAPDKSPAAILACPQSRDFDDVGALLAALRHMLDDAGGNPSLRRAAPVRPRGHGRDGLDAARRRYDGEDEMSPASITRRGLVQAAGAAIGAVGLPIAASAVPAPALDPDAALIDLIARHADADTAFDEAEAEADRLYGVALAAHPPRPDALRWRPGDFSRTSMGVGLSDPVGGGEARVYRDRAILRLRDRPAETWFPSVRLGPECEARRVEILEAFDAWTAKLAVVDDRSGYTAAAEAWDAADAVLADLTRSVLEATPATLAGLAAKARWATGSGLPDSVVAGRLRRVAEDTRALAERGGVGS